MAATALFPGLCSLIHYRERMNPVVSAERLLFHQHKKNPGISAGALSGASLKAIEVWGLPVQSRDALGTVNLQVIAYPTRVKKL
jgi:hypothetical protein